MLSESVLTATKSVLQLAELEQILRNLEEEAKERKSQLEQVLLVMYIMHITVMFPLKGIIYEICDPLLLPVNL